MKPKTRIQKEVARLSTNLRPISATQIDWAYRHCVEHIGYRTKKGNITCSDCGHEWHSNSGLCDSLDGCGFPYLVVLHVARLEGTGLASVDVGAGFPIVEPVVAHQ